MIELTLKRIAETKDSTCGMLWHGDTFLSFVIEDGHREPKVLGETRIPAGRYKIEKQRIGRFYNKYKVTYNHSFVPHLLNVPGFEGILIHIGNGIQDTRGCLLPNMQLGFNGKNFFGTGSADAYKMLYLLLDRHDDITITITDI